MSIYLASTWTITLLIIALVAIVALVALYFVGNRLQKKQESADQQMKAAGQTMSILVIDKKRMKLKDSNLPKMVIDQTPKYLRGTKVPLVKAKVGPQIITLICDPQVYEIIPVKKEVKAVISGIYITEVKGIRGNLEHETEKQKNKRLKKEKRTQKFQEAKDAIGINKKKKDDTK